MTLQYIQNRAIFLNIAAVLDRNYTSRHGVFSFYLQAKSDKNNLLFKKKNHVSIPTRNFGIKSSS